MRQSTDKCIHCGCPVNEGVLYCSECARLYEPPEEE